MENLNKFELTLMERLVIKYPYIKSHIPYLKVKNRKNTGVGMYVYFCYSEGKDIIEDMDISFSLLSTNEIINIKGLEYGLGFAVSVVEGKIHRIELFTYGEAWDGSLDSFSFSE